jgi:phosphatidylserine decarboxylase
MNVNMRESLKLMDTFNSFNDFFTREIDLSHRPVNQNDEICVAPCDGRVMVYPKISADSEIRIKSSSFKLGSFLQDDNLGQKYSDGSMLISRLYLTDYHHFHFPDSGLPKKSSTMDGKYYATSPYSISSLTPFYTENHRMLTQFKSDNFGEIVISEIGAFTVGSIKQQYEPDALVGKGEHKGFFELGGSTIVLLFEKGSVIFDSDLIRNSKYDLETYVRQGDSIGRSVKINNNNIHMEINA